MCCPSASNSRRLETPGRKHAKVMAWCCSISKKPFDPSSILGVVASVIPPHCGFVCNVFFLCVYAISELNFLSHLCGAYLGITLRRRSAKQNGAYFPCCCFPPSLSCGMPSAQVEQAGQHRCTHMSRETYRYCFAICIRVLVFFPAVYFPIQLPLHHL